MNHQKGLSISRKCRENGRDFEVVNERFWTVTSQCRTMLAAMVVSVACFTWQGTFASGSVDVVSQNFETVDGVLVRGKIRADDGLPLAGANVYLKSSQAGTSTNAEGKFEFPIRLKPGDVIVVSFVGYERIEYVIPDSKEVNIELVMKLDTTVGGEVAVTEVYQTRQNRIGALWGKIKTIF